MRKRRSDAEVELHHCSESERTASAGGGDHPPSALARRSLLPIIAPRPLGRASTFWRLCSLSIGLGLWSGTCLGGPEEVGGAAAGERLVIEAAQEIEELNVEAIRQGRFRPHTILSVDMAKVPLRKAVKVFVQRTGIKVLVAAAVPDEELTIKFEELPLEEAVKRLLKGKNYLLKYGQSETVASLLEDQGSQALGAEKSETAKSGNGAKESEQKTDPNDAGERQISEIRILSSSGGDANQNLIEIKEEPGERAHEIEALVEKAQKGATAQDRLAAIKEFQGLAGDEEIPAILPALQHEDENVRGEALAALQNISSGNPPVDEIADMAGRDPNPRLRMEALDALVEFESGRAEAYIQEALQDTDPKVRSNAKRLLELNAKVAENLEIAKNRQESLP